MFEYFPENYTWNLAFMSGMNRGGALGDLDEACRSLKAHAGRRDAVAQQAWYESFMKVAERSEALARRDEEAGNLFSAGRKYVRAGVYYLLAERMPSHKNPGKAVAYGKALAAYEKGYRLRGDPVERADIPFKGTSLPALFSKAPGPGRAPCVVHFDGFDITKELIYGAAAEEYRRRGISLLIVDHPGVGEALRLRGLAGSHDTEVPAAACVDYVQTRADVDPQRIALQESVLAGIMPRARRRSRSASSAACAGARCTISTRSWKAAPRIVASRRCQDTTTTPSGCLANKVPKRCARSRAGLPSRASWTKLLARSLSCMAKTTGRSHCSTPSAPIRKRSTVRCVSSRCSLFPKAVPSTARPTTTPSRWTTWPIGWQESSEASGRLRIQATS